MASFAIGSEGQFTVSVSDCDLAHLTQWRWNFIRAHKGIYARRRSSRGSRQSAYTLQMSHYVLEQRMGQPRPSEKHDADHIDGNTLNNTRENLRWLHQKENRGRRTLARIKFFDRRRGHGRDVPVFV